jgi:DNA-binding NtrC family response regulator
MTANRILVVDDEDSLRRVLQVQLEQSGYSVDTAADAQQALSVLQEAHYDLVITDMRMPGASGLDLLKQIQVDHPGVPVIMLTAFATIETAVEAMKAMKAGAYHYITKPVHADELRVVVDRALEHVGLLEEVRNLRASLDQKYGFENIIGRSDALLRVLDMAARAAQTDSTVLIRGETGTGKELLARAIHFNSRRKSKLFVTINCGPIPTELLESELFGYLKGSFTSALTHKKGKIETADGGTLFLDEIGEMPLELQVKLLRLIQQGEIEKVGATETTRVDVRIVAATHRNLQSMIEDGEFREDLYYRLAVIPLTLPSLRERLEDIPDLVSHLFSKIKEKHGKAGTDASGGPTALFLAASLAGQCSGDGERSGADNGAGPPRRDHAERSSRLSPARAARFRSAASGIAAAGNQPGRSGKRADPAGVAKVQLESDAGCEVSGSQSKDSHLPYGKTRNPPA